MKEEETIDELAVNAGSRIKILRGALTQASFAEKLGISQNYLSQIETGSVKPSIEVLFAIKRLCDVSIDHILVGEEAQALSFVRNQSFVKCNNFQVKNMLAKQAFRHLDGCVDAVRQLDEISYARIEELEERVKVLEVEKGSGGSIHTTGATFHG